jgi:ligand-binding SRPBCC domain-containing protein
MSTAAKSENRAAQFCGSAILNLRLGSIKKKRSPQLTKWKTQLLQGIPTRPPANTNSRQANRTVVACVNMTGNAAMKLFTLTAEQWIPEANEMVFSFFADPSNLEQLTPPWLHFRILNPVRKVQAGTRIDYRLRLHGIPLRWQSEITVWEPPFRFVDVQTRGPYRAWIHEHTFEARAGGTLMRDTVTYAVIGGSLVRRLFVAPDLKRIFEYRRTQLETLFGGEP